MTGPRPRVFVDVEISQNVWAHAPLELARVVLGRLLAHRPTGIGLQEWPNGRNDLLRELPGHQLHRLPRARRAWQRIRRQPWKPRDGFTWFRPLRSPTAPIGRDASRYELLHGYAAVLTGPRKIRPTEKHPKANLPANLATVAIWYDHDLDEKVADVEYHLWAGVQVDGHYSTRGIDRARVAGHRDQVAALTRLVADLLAKHDVVYARGDSNFSGLTIPGLTSAWVGRMNIDVGTHGDGRRKIDDVHGPTRPIGVDVIHHPEKQIDHGGVVAVRNRIRSPQ